MAMGTVIEDLVKSVLTLLFVVLLGLVIGFVVIAVGKLVDYRDKAFTITFSRNRAIGRTQMLETARDQIEAELRIDVEAKKSEN